MGSCWPADDRGLPDPRPDPGLHGPLWPPPCSAWSIARGQDAAFTERSFFGVMSVTNQPDPRQGGDRSCPDPRHDPARLRRRGSREPAAVRRSTTYSPRRRWDSRPRWSRRAPAGEHQGRRPGHRLGWPAYKRARGHPDLFSRSTRWSTAWRAIRAGSPTSPNCAVRGGHDGPGRCPPDAEPASPRALRPADHRRLLVRRRADPPADGPGARGLSRSCSSPTGWWCCTCPTAIWTSPYRHRWRPTPWAPRLHQICHPEAGSSPSHGQRLTEALIVSPTEAGLADFRAGSAAGSVPAKTDGAAVDRRLRWPCSAPCGGRSVRQPERPSVGRGREVDGQADGLGR